MNSLPLTAADAMAAGHAISRLINALSEVVLGRRRQIQAVLVGCLSGGHVLIDDVPGTGKTLLAETLAVSLNVPLRRVQFSVDLLPSDLLGTSLYQPDTGQVTFHPGPLADAHLVLVDDINRARPSTQAALLEAMAEGQVTVEGQTYPLASPFMLLATQNPAEHEGTFPLPAAQMDRFAVRVHLGYPPKDAELAMLDRALMPSPSRVQTPILDMAEWHELQRTVRRVHVSWAVLAYITLLSDRLRAHPLIGLGPSPRASQFLARTGQALALVHGRAHVLPDDIQALLEPVLAHRLVLAPGAMLHSVQTNEILNELQMNVPVPWDQQAWAP